jgi:hypothetical protein
MRRYASFRSSGSCRRPIQPFLATRACSRQLAHRDGARHDAFARSHRSELQSARSQVSIVANVHSHQTRAKISFAIRSAHAMLRERFFRSPGMWWPLAKHDLRIGSCDSRPGSESVGGDDIDVRPQLKDDLRVVRPVGSERDFPPPPLHLRILARAACASRGAGGARMTLQARTQGLSLTVDDAPSARLRRAC